MKTTTAAAAAIAIVCSSENGNGAARGPPHVAVLATPGMGHLIPLAELAKRLAALHDATTTAITYASTASATQRAFLASLPPAIASAISTRMSEECVRSVPTLTSLLLDPRRSNGGRGLAEFVADLFGADALDAAGVRRRCIFFPTNLHTLTLILHLPELEDSVACEFRDLPEPLRLPGCVPIPSPDVLMALQEKADPAYRWMAQRAAVPMGGAQPQRRRRRVNDNYYDAESKDPFADLLE